LGASQEKFEKVTDANSGFISSFYGIKKDSNDMISQMQNPYVQQRPESQEVNRFIDPAQLNFYNPYSQKVGI
jgi:hypothetical protein